MDANRGQGRHGPSDCHIVGLYPASDFAAFKIDESTKSLEEALLASLNGISALPADAQFGLTISGTALITLLANH